MRLIVLAGTLGARPVGRAVGSRTWPTRPTTAAAGPTALLTVPNLLSLLRLAGVPLFLYLLLGPHADGWAILVLAVGGFTDWLDGKLARLLGQQSRLGRPARPGGRPALHPGRAGRARRARGRAVVGGGGAGRPRPGAGRARCRCCARRGYGPYRVSYLGKSATFLLLYAFPLLLLGQGTGSSPSWPARSGSPSRSGGPRSTSTPALLYLAQFVLAMRTPAAGDPAASGRALGSPRDPRGPALHHRPRMGARAGRTGWSGSASPITPSPSSATSSSSSCPRSATRVTAGCGGRRGGVHQVGLGHLRAACPARSSRSTTLSTTARS